MKILVLGGTGMLGRPVVAHLARNGHTVRVIARSVDRVRGMFEDAVEIVEGNATDRGAIQAALMGCQGVHMSLAQNVELIATRHIVDVAPRSLERMSYISATTAFAENRWFGLVDAKMRCEELLRKSGIPLAVFCPTWAMETLQNFVCGNRGTVIIGKNPPKLHFFAATDLGRMVTASYDDESALGRRLFIHGPEGVTLPDAIERFIEVCHPEVKVTRLKLWQARFLAKMLRVKGLAYPSQLIDYFDKVGELGDPTEANGLYGPPTITLDQWFEIQKR